MKKTQYSEERFMSILWDLYRKTTNGETIITYGDFCKQHSITNALFPILVQHKVLKSEKIQSSRKGKKSSMYSWASITPNIHMAKRLMDEIKKRAKDAREKHKEKKMQQQLVNEEYQVSEMIPSPINPVYEMKQTSNVDSTQQIYDVSIPIQQGNSNPVTLSSDAVNVTKTAPNQKSISILWGLISIKW